MNHEWILKRNCSLSPRQVAQAYGALCAIVLGIGVAFTLHGAWFVLAFALIETFAVALALFHYARHASDREHISLSDGCLMIEHIEGGKASQVRLEPAWTRIIAPNRRHGLILLESCGRSIAVGTFVPLEARQRLVGELRHALLAASLPSVAMSACR